MARLFFAFAFCSALLGQQTGSVSGTVLNSANHQPLRKALVTITSLAPDRSYAAAVTDGSGHFILPGIPAGNYRLLAAYHNAPGIPYGALSPGRPGVSFHLGSGESRSDVRLLWASRTTISGVVIDPDGDGVRGATITVYRKTFDRGTFRLTVESTAGTDVKGNYTAVLRRPGDYFVAADGRNSPTLRIHPASVGGEPAPSELLNRQFYPGSDVANTASPVHTALSQELKGIDFRLSYVPQVSVHGSVSGVPDEARLSTFLLTDTDRSVADRNRPAPGRTPNSFRFDRLLPGSYRLVAETQSRRTVVKLQLAASDTEVNLALMPGTTISGSITVEGAGDGLQKSSRISLMGVDDLPVPQLRARVEDGNFEFQEVPTGTWEVVMQPLPRGAYIKSMHFGTRDVLLQDLEVKPESKGVLNIVVSTNAPKVTGAVAPAGPATILAAPLEPFASRFRFYQTAQADETGKFTFEGLRPGSYRFYAFTDLEPQAWQSPGFLTPFQDSAKVAELKEGAVETLSLRVIAGPQ